MKKYKNILKGFIITVLVCILFCVSTTGVFAHEIVYNGTTPIPLKWYDVTNRTAKLKICGEYLNADYSGYYSTIRNAWPNASARVSVTNTDFSSSNVDLVTASTDYWSERWGANALIVLGVCDIVSTDGYEIATVQDAIDSSRLIAYAGIFYTPNGGFANATHRKKVMVHEIGHALGLGHPNDIYYPTNEASVMRQGTVETYYTPRTHDINDLNNKY